MKRAAHPPEAPALFDLPLAQEESAPERTARRRRPRPAESEPRERPSEPPRPLPLFPEGSETASGPADERPGAPDSPAAATHQPKAEPRPRAEGRSLASRRLRAGLLDLAALGAVLVILVGGLWSMGVTPRLAFWPAAGVFLLVFSFLYHSLPLAFWGQTPAMAVTELVARAADGGPLTFAQTALRWLGSTLTVLAAGLPMLLLPTGRSLADRLSGSITRARRPAGGADRA